MESRVFENGKLYEFSLQKFKKTVGEKGYMMGKCWAFTIPNKKFIFKGNTGKRTIELLGKDALGSPMYYVIEREWCKEVK